VNSRAIKPSNSSDFSFELRTPDRQSGLNYSPKGPFLSEALDCIHSVRFSKFERFELLMNLSGEEVLRPLSVRRVAVASESENVG
jgi:hypothetical protein